MSPGTSSWTAKTVDFGFGKDVKCLGFKEDDEQTGSSVRVAVQLTRYSVTHQFCVFTRSYAGQITPLNEDFGIPEESCSQSLQKSESVAHDSKGQALLNMDWTATPLLLLACLSVAEAVKASVEETILFIAFVVVGITALILLILKTLTESTVYSAVSKRPAHKTKSQDNLVKINHTDGEGATSANSFHSASSDNEPKSDSSLHYAENPLLEVKKTANRDEWRKIISIPTVFIAAVLLFIAVIAISITLLSFYAQNSMVSDLTTEIQDEIGKNFLGQVNETFQNYNRWGQEIQSFSDYYFKPGYQLPLNESAYQTYPEFFQYLISSMIHKDIGSGFNVGFSNQKGFGGGYELFGVDVFDTVLVNGTAYLYVSILPPSLNFSALPNPDPNAFYKIPAGPNVVADIGCPAGAPTTFWQPLYPQPTGTAAIEISILRTIRVCQESILTYFINITVKFTRFAALLQGMVQQVKGRAFIVETNGAIVASTTGSQPFASTAKGYERYFATNTTDLWIREAWKIYLADTKTSQSTHTIDGVNYFILPSSYESGDGVSWIILHLAESDPYLGTIRTYIRRTGIVVGVVVAAAVILAVLASFWITRPFTHLTRQLQKAAKMQLTEEDISVPFLFEARRLHQAFVTMRDAMKSFQRYIPEALVKTRMDYKDLKHLVEIGSGAYGVVYQADWNGEIVAVKQIKTELIDERQMSEFLSEVSILQQLTPHPNVVLFRAATFPPQPLSMITEFCGGGSLYAHIRKYPNLAVKEKLRLISEIAKGMRHLHQQKVVHRDLALRNILLNDRLEAKVSDFGLSRVNGSEDGSTTANAVGPLKWMSPEAITENKYSTKSDVFSFGVVVWEIFEEKDPYPGVAAVEAAFQVVNGQRLEFTKCPCPWLIRLVQACWDKDPKNRPSFKFVLQTMVNESIPDAKEFQDNNDDVEMINIVIPPPIVSTEDE
ncbi:hypothetical protein PROFUN_05500 [Planoprotostelium fungivorum]|uniref:Uncharacterized protein n=1 Tax=Planoprotostelium fungivorum TaxID=1890364 RepID=A0A2P6NQX2_9EUKA|nr:hypothetical protein PROFUN_05500 [Planoprotostelium fungivorum]